jgi:7-cyano-7-deazaguanine reductase
MAEGREKLSDTTGLTQLGSPRPSLPERRVETFPFRHAGNKTVVTFRCSEFTCYCPLTGQPDYATIDIEYMPLERAIESKSLRNYLWSFRETGVFHEDVTNVILNDLFAQVAPRWMQVTTHFNVRGGIAIDVSAHRGER